MFEFSSVTGPSPSPTREKKLFVPVNEKGVFTSLLRMAAERKPNSHEAALLAECRQPQREEEKEEFPVDVVDDDEDESPCPSPDAVADQEAITESPLPAPTPLSAESIAVGNAVAGSFTLPVTAGLRSIVNSVVAQVQARSRPITARNAFNAAQLRKTVTVRNCPSKHFHPLPQVNATFACRNVPVCRMSITARRLYFQSAVERHRQKM